MMTMEHWGNRLFPKMTFDEVIERVEKLGKKKPVQVGVGLSMLVLLSQMEGNVSAFRYVNTTAI